jgi:membrane protease YdiL (CAAX protease family)
MRYTYIKVVTRKYIASGLGDIVMNIAYIPLLSYILLGFSFLSLWIKRIPFLFWGLISVVIGLGLFGNHIHWTGLLALAAFGFLVKESYQKRSPFHSSLLILFKVFIFIFAWGFYDHLIPGFSNWRMISGVKISYDSIPYTAYLNFDKTLCCLLILYFTPILQKKPLYFPALLKTIYKPAFAGIIITCMAALLLNYIRVDIKVPDFAFFWVVNNLLFVCIAEETLFRGFMQQSILNQHLGEDESKQWLNILIAALLFGLYHHRGGIEYIFLATLAGCFYGYIFQKTKRIEASILAHFTLNLIHFLFFSYPALMR